MTNNERMVKERYSDLPLIEQAEMLDFYNRTGCSWDRMHGLTKILVIVFAAVYFGGGLIAGIVGILRG